MKLFILTFCALAAVLIGGIFAFGIPKSENLLISELNDLGFKHVRITKSVPTPLGLSIAEIQLDKDGFNTIENLQINVFWPTSLFNPQIRNLHVEKLQFAVVPSEIRKILSQFDQAFKKIVLH